MRRGQPGTIDDAGAWLLLLLALCIFLAPVVFRGEVIASHDGRRGLGLDPLPSSRPSNLFNFKDHANSFVPELVQHLDRPFFSAPALWTPNVELGRPAFHGVWSKTYPPTRILSVFFDDAYRLYTWLAVLSVFFSGIFSQLFLRARNLAPVACLVGSSGLATGVYMAYWLSFVVYLSVPLWTMALLWAVTRYLQRPGVGWWVAISAFVHGLLLSGYAQHILYSGVLITGYVVIEAWSRSAPIRGRLQRIVGPASAALVGIASVVPVYLDVALNWANSARRGVSLDFLLSVNPSIKSFKALAQQFELLFDALWLGNPVLPEFGIRFLGVSLTPLIAMLIPLTLLRGPPKEVRWWQLFLIASLVFTWWEPAYLFGIEHLGMGISRFPPLVAGYVPALVLAAFATDRVLRLQPRDRRGAVLVCTVPLALVCLAAIVSPERLQPGDVLVGLAIGLGTLAFVWTRATWVAVVLVLASTLHYGAPQLLSRPRHEVARTSPLVEKIRAAARGPSRYAWVDGWVIAPNREIELGLRSVHSYNSLSSELYQNWTRRLSPEGPGDYGRIFALLGSSDRLDPNELALSGVALLLSTQPLDPRIARRLGEYRGVGFYRPHLPPIHQAQLEHHRQRASGVFIDADLAGDARLLARRIADEGDRLTFRMTPSERPTLLFVSQQFHPDWRAFVGGRTVETTLVNGFYQGVHLPPGTGEVQLEFRPYTRFAWVPQGVLFAGAAMAAWLELHRRRDRGSARAGSGKSRAGPHGRVP